MNEDVLIQFLHYMANINNTALCICEWAENNGEVLPADLNWSHVATANKMLSDLLEIASFAGISVQLI